MTSGVPGRGGRGALRAPETAILHPVGDDGPLQPTRAPHTEFLTLPEGGINLVANCFGIPLKELFDDCTVLAHQLWPSHSASPTASQCTL